MEKKRILIISDSIKRTTGYSTVAINIINELITKDKYVIAQLGLADVTVPENFTQSIHYYSTLKDHSKCCGRGGLIEYYNPDENKNYQITPSLNTTYHNTQQHCLGGKGLESDVFAQESCFYVIQHFKPDIVIAVNDIWALYHLNYIKNREKFLYIPYLAVDSECFPVTIPQQHPDLPIIDTIKFFAASNNVILFTNWAKGVVEKTTKIATRGKVPSNIKIIPHGVNREHFYPLDNKTELRKKYFNFEKDEDVFLLGFVSRNQIRKRIDAIFQSMRKFIDKYEVKNGKKLYCHFHTTMNDPNGWDIRWLATYYGVAERCIFDNKLRPGSGVSVDKLNELINCYDASLLLSTSEGWGLSILESMSAGVPVITSDYSAQGDWAKGVALLAKIAETYHEIKTCHIKAVVDTSHVAHLINLLYSSPKMCREYSRKGIELANELRWSNVVEKWEKLIDETDVDMLGTDERYDISLIKEKHKFKLPEDPVNTEFELVEV